MNLLRPALAVLLAGVCAVRAQITNPVDINLVPVWVGNDYKYGIYATVGGSTSPQLFEFDTGGSGFYAVYGPGAPSFGPGYGLTGQTFTNSYDSGDVYTGNIVNSSVAVYSAVETGGGAYTYSSTPSFTTTTNIVVGQTTNLVNTNGKPNDWPLQGTNTAPVQNAFFGDFGLSMKYSTNGIMNVLGEIPYGTNVIPGFVVKLGYEGNPNASVQVGLETNYASTYTTLITMSGRDTTNTFLNTGLPSYSQQVISGSMILSNAVQGQYATNIDLTLDTGATLTIHDLTSDTSSLTNYFSTASNGDISVTNGVQFSLTTLATNGTNVSLLWLATEADKGDPNYISVQLGSNYYINVGSSIFYNYDVLYDIQNGVVGLRAVPEANQVVLVLAGLIGVVAFSLVKTLTRGKRRRRS